MGGRHGCIGGQVWMHRCLELVDADGSQGQLAAVGGGLLPHDVPQRPNLRAVP